MPRTSRFDSVCEAGFKRARLTSQANTALPPGRYTGTSPGSGKLSARAVSSRRRKVSAHGNNAPPLPCRGIKVFRAPHFDQTAHLLITAPGGHGQLNQAHSQRLEVRLMRRVPLRARPFRKAQLKVARRNARTVPHYPHGQTARHAADCKAQTMRKRHRRTQQRERQQGRPVGRIVPKEAPRLLPVPCGRILYSRWPFAWASCTAAAVWGELER